MFPVAFLNVGSLRLNITDDYLQTAVDAFLILSEGNLDDVLALPADYVLSSTRTISMMNLPTEKRVALWTVVKAGRETKDIPYEVLARFRPLFKYVNAREMADLNMSDPRILVYLGSHPELDRHKVGVIAGKYMEINPYWQVPKYMSMMKNLLCGIPMKILRNLSPEIYLQLSGEVFYHINACAPLQKRFFLMMMSRNDVLGRAYSWTAHDVSRLGMLLTELDSSNLTSINPAAMNGISAQAMLQLSEAKLQHLSKAHIDNLSLKALHILTKKMKRYQDAKASFSDARPRTAKSQLFWIPLYAILFLLISNL